MIYLDTDRGARAQGGKLGGLSRPCRPPAAVARPRAWGGRPDRIQAPFVRPSVTYN